MTYNDMQFKILRKALTLYIEKYDNNSIIIPDVPNLDEYVEEAKVMLHRASGMHKRLLKKTHASRKFTNQKKLKQGGGDHPPPPITRNRKDYVMRYNLKQFNILIKALKEFIQKYSSEEIFRQDMVEDAKVMLHRLKGAKKRHVEQMKNKENEDDVSNHNM